MVKHLILFAAGFAILATPASASPDSKAVRILNNQTESNSTAAGTSAQTAMTVGPFRQRAIVYVTAHGRSHYSGPVQNAGIILTLSEGDHSISDDSFEGESANIIFNAALSHMFVLPRGTTRIVRAQVDPMGNGGTQRNRDTRVHMDLIAIAAE